MTLLEFKESFEKDFEQYILGKIEEVKILGAYEHTQNLFSYVYPLSKNGKRFRPYLTQTSYALCGGKKPIHSYLFSLELLHLFALIHDDIMDESRSRHGILTAHEKFKEYYNQNNTQKKTYLLSISQAMLLGDLVFAWSQECLSEEDHQKAKKQYHTLIKEVTIGQSMDVAFSGILHVDEKTILQKASLKSGNYSIMHPLVIGALLANANEETLLWITNFGFKLGLLFQIQDDLLDCMKTTEEIGKTAFNDIRTKQQTLISWFMLKNTEEKNVLLFSSLYGKEILSADEEATLKNLLKESGALAYSIEKIQTLEKELSESILNSTFNEEQKKIWTTLLHTITKRSR